MYVNEYEKCTLIVHSFSAHLLNTHTRAYYLTSLNKTETVLTFWRWWSSEEDTFTGKYNKTIRVHSSHLSVSCVHYNCHDGSDPVTKIILVTVFPAPTRVQDHKYSMNVEETCKLHRSIFSGGPEIVRAFENFFEARAI